MRLLLSRVCGPLTVAAAVLALPIPGAAQTLTTAGTAAHRQTRRRRRHAESLRRADAAQRRQAAQPAARRRGPLAEDTRSLFAPRWNMFQLSGPR